MNFLLKYKRILVLGFYDRSNAGDEMYKVAFKRVFKDWRVKLLFCCTDDIMGIPDDVDCVICGGGDIVNSYFMARVEKLIAGYTGRVYALSVGIPYESEARYLHMFDHVFVRSMGDMKIAVKEIGASNVTYLPDAAFAVGGGKIVTTNTNVIKLGVCLAQPAFANNAHAEELLEALTGMLCRLGEKYMNLEVNLFSFNSGTNIDESDWVVNEKLVGLLGKRVKVVNLKGVVGPEAILEKMREMNVMLCMRYHSLVFSLMLGKQIVALYCAPKVGRLVDDFKENLCGMYKMDVDGVGRPLGVDAGALFEMLDDACKGRKAYALKSVNWNAVGKLVLDQKKVVRMLVKNSLESFDNVLFMCKKLLMKYLNIGSVEYEGLLRRRGVFAGNMSLARLVCYTVTKSVGSAYVWGLYENMKREDFCLYDAVKYIWEDCSRLAGERQSASEMYYPDSGAKRTRLVMLDYVFQNDFKGYHRSGWAYVIGGLMNFDAHQLMRSSDLMVDTYVDRSFHWGMDTLMTVGVLPYVRPWIGFVHHTFDTTHSSYNCVELFKNAVFLESLKCCRGLIALTEYLARGLRKSLVNHGFGGQVKVFVLYHPMEVVDLGFSMSKFLANPNRKVVQVGAWLRDPYGIYELNLWRNKLGLSKCALKGRDMDHYFIDRECLEGIREYLFNVRSNGSGEMCRPYCISGNQVNYLCNSVNKYCVGLYDTIERNHKSVTVLERVDNAAYDLLLSENVVFLKLVDCSAVNTVLECLMRCTVIVVNRHPAVEEILGVGYPGFYEDMVSAGLILNDIDTLKACYSYLKKLPKDKFTLDAFLRGFQDILSSVS